MATLKIKYENGTQETIENAYTVTHPIHYRALREELLCLK